MQSNPHPVRSRRFHYIGLSAVLTLLLTLSLLPAAGPLAPQNALAAGTTVTDISAGGDHTCAIDSDNQLWCWGNNADGQIGTGNSGGDVLTPVRISDPDATDPTTELADAIAVSAGANHTCAVDSANRAWCWGANDRGELGNAGSVSGNSPIRVDAGNGLIAAATISTYNNHTCAVDTSGKTWCWGGDAGGRLGNVATGQQLVPDEVAENVASNTIDTVDVGSTHSCARSTGDDVWCWGANANGQVGDGSTSNRTTPGAALLNGSQTVSTGGTHTCSIDTGGQARCWGDNTNGQLGINSTTQQLSPVALPTLTNAAEIDLGLDHSCAIDTNGQTICWGDNGKGQLGDGSNSQRLVPTNVSDVNSLITAARISAGDTHTCAIDTNGQAWCWGNNTNGQLGDGTQTERNIPDKVDFPFIVTTVTGYIPWRNPDATGSTTDTDIWAFEIDTQSNVIQRNVDDNWELNAIADFDGDGLADDLFWRDRSTTEVITWLNLSPSSETLLGTVSNDWEFAAIADFNGDNTDDILMYLPNEKYVGDTGIYIIWLITDGGIAQVDDSYILGKSNFKSPGATDMDNDGDADILLYNQDTGLNVVWEIEASEYLSPTIYLGDSTSGDGWTIAGVGNFLGSDAGILIQNPNLNTVYVWAIDNLAYQGSFLLPGAPAASFRLAGIFDLDNDNDDDLLWRNVSTGANKLWLNNGLGFSFVERNTNSKGPAWEPVLGVNDYKNLGGVGPADVGSIDPPVLTPLGPDDERPVVMEPFDPDEELPGIEVFVTPASEPMVYLPLIRR